jgi:hypothetical protein
VWRAVRHSPYSSEPLHAGVMRLLTATSRPLVSIYNRDGKLSGYCFIDLSIYRPSTTCNE